MPARAQRWLAPGLAVGVVAALAVAAEQWAPIARARAFAGRGSVAASAFASPKIRTALLRRGDLALQPPGDLLALRRRRADGRCPEVAIGPDAIQPGEAPSSLLAPAADVAGGGLPLVSLYLEPCRLERIEANPDGFGEEWEEPGWVSVFAGGRRIFESPAGVRLHGGFTRKSHVNKSFRLYFRDRYGSRSFPANLLAAGAQTGDSRQVVLHNDLRRDFRTAPWHFVNPLAYDIARRVGALAPATLPVRFAVNGQLRPPYVLTEHIDLDWLRRRFGHDEFDLLRAKGDREPAEQALMDGAARWALDAPAPLRMAAVAEHFDLDNLMRWFVAVMVCSTGDVFQAVMARDHRPEAPDGRWFFVAWDMDMSFRRPRGAQTEGWQRDQLRFVRTRPPGTTMPPRIVLHRLLNEDPAFREALARRVVEVLNHRVDAAFLRELRDHYAALARAVPLTDLRYLDELDRYFALRFDELFRQMATQLEIGPPLAVTVDGPAGALAVDGYEVPASYRGRYPAGLTVRVTRAPGWRGEIRGWRVNGVVRPATDELVLVVTQPLEIAAVTAP